MFFKISGIVGKGISGVTSKIFGKPYDRAEAEKQKQIEEQRNTVIPQLGITAGEFEDKIKNNPKALEKVQQDPMLAREIQSNPKLLLDLLDGKEIKTKPKDVLISPLNASIINGKRPTNVTNNNNQTNLFDKKTKESNKNNTKAETGSPQDTATYVPSSAFVAKDQTMSPELTEAYNRMMSESDKILKKAEKYI